MKIRSLCVVAICTLCVTVARSGDPASFDCAHTAMPREQLICHDPKLSDLDSQLGQLYRERLARLSRSGAELLQRSEQSWLHYIAVVCPLNKPATLGDWWTPKSCLEQNYQERLRQLQKAAIRIGPFIFNRVDIFAAKPSGDDSGSEAGFYTDHVAYPQIDNPQTPGANAWNKKNVKQLGSGGDCGDGDYESDYDIGYATDKLISLDRTFSEYCHGAAHPMGWGEAENTIFAPEPHNLTAQDLFGTEDNWQPALRKLFWDALLASGWEPPDNQADSVKKEIEDLVVDPKRWQITAEGLMVSFYSYEGGCYACTPQPVTVAWRDLKPLLSPSAVVP